MKRIVAILIAAALLLTSCGIIFRDEIREIFEEFFVKYIYSGDETNANTIEDVYELTYLPEEYHLKDKKVRPLRIQWEFANDNNDIIEFEQRVIAGTDFSIDSESGYSRILEIDKYDVYYRKTAEKHNFVWSNGKYSFFIKSNIDLSNEEIVRIIDGITTK